MNTYTDKHKTIVTAEAIEPYRRVKLNGSQLLAYADAGEDYVGVSTHYAASGAVLTIKLPNDSGTNLIEAGGIIVAGAVVYGAADGKIDDTASGDEIGLALEAASASGVLVEVLHSKTSELGSIDIASANTTAINVSVAQTDETDLDAACVFQHGSYSTALAYGTQTDHLVLKSMNITAGATAVYVFGDINRITTSATSTGYMNPSYAYLSVGHDLVNGWAVRGRCDITATCEIGEMAGLLGTVDVAASTVITQTGAPPLAGAILSATIGAGATVEQEVMCLEIRPLIGANIAGSTSGIRVNVNCSSANYLDYGIDIRSMSANQTAALRILMTGDTAALPAAIVLEGQSSSTSTITTLFKVNGLTTYFADFSGTDGSENTAYEADANAATGIVGKVMLNTSAGAKGYINVYSTPN